MPTIAQRVPMSPGQRVDIGKLRLQDSGELIEKMQQHPNDQTRQTGKVLKDHRDDLNALLKVCMQQENEIYALEGLTGGTAVSQIVKASYKTH